MRFLGFWLLPLAVFLTVTAQWPPGWEKESWERSYEDEDYSSEETEPPSTTTTTTTLEPSTTLSTTPSTTTTSTTPTTTTTTRGPTTPAPIAQAEEHIVGYFARHIHEVANISERLAALERIVVAQADLIVLNQHSTEVALGYAQWNASLHAQNVTARAVEYLLEELLNDFRADFNRAEFKRIDALEDYGECDKLKGPQWKGVCDALARNVHSAIEASERAQKRVVEWSDRLRSIRRQQKALDSIDTTKIQSALLMSHMVRKEKEQQLAAAAVQLAQFPDQQWTNAPDDFVSELLPQVEIAFVPSAQQEGAAIESFPSGTESSGTEPEDAQVEEH